MLQKSSTKTRIETFSSPFSLPSFYFRLQKSSTKTRIETLYEIADFMLFAVVAKVVYENKDWNLLLLLRSTRSLLSLQKSSTKTRIETSNLLKKGLIQKQVSLVK